MDSIRRFLIALCACLTVLCATAAGAWGGEAPEYGRCEKLGALRLGEYFDHSCNNPDVAEEGEPHYEWFPLFGSEPAKTGFTLSGTKVELETAQKTKLTCDALAGSGEYTAESALTTGPLTLSGCELAKGPGCQSLGSPAGTIVTAGLDSPALLQRELHAAIGPKPAATP